MTTVTFADAIDLAVQHQQAGRLAEAERIYRLVLDSEPNEFNARHLLGVIERRKGNPARAADLIRQAIAINPAVAEAHGNLGNALAQVGRIDEAARAFAAGLRINPHGPQVLNNLGTCHHRLGRNDEAAACFAEAVRQDPAFTEAAMNLSALLSTLVPGWHLPMMNDTTRNDAYERALRRAIRPDHTVLEIGTGSGLLAMMAARAGARRVVTCEMAPTIAETARQIVARNGYADRVAVVARMSNDVAVGRELPEPADLLVSEILSNDFLSEGVLPSLEDARARLIKPGALIIPAGGAIRAILAGGEVIEKTLHVGEVAGFDLSPFNAITPRKKAIELHGRAFDAFSAAFEAFSFDFTRPEPYPAAEVSIAVPVTRSGRCHGVLQWIWLKMDEETEFENHPAHRRDASGWQHILFQFAEPVDLREGQVVHLHASHNRHRPWFRLERVT